MIAKVIRLHRVAPEKSLGKQLAWLIERSDGYYLKFHDASTSFVWSLDVHAAQRYQSEEAARQAWLVICDHDALLEDNSRGKGVRFTEHEWVST